MIFQAMTDSLNCVSTPWQASMVLAEVPKVKAVVCDVDFKPIPQNPVGWNELERSGIVAV